MQVGAIGNCSGDSPNLLFSQSVLGPIKDELTKSDMVSVDVRWSRSFHFNNLSRIYLIKGEPIYIMECEGLNTSFIAPNSINLSPIRLRDKWSNQ